MDRKTATAGTESARQPGLGVASVHAVALIAGVAVILFTSGLDRWPIGPLAVLLAFTTVSAVTDIATGVSKLHVSGVPIGLTTAFVLLGPGPAALLGVVTMLALWLRTRCTWHSGLNNVTTFMLFPLVAGLFFHETVRLAGLGPHAMAYYLVVFPTFIVALVVNFFGVVGFRCYLEGSSIAYAARMAVMPIMAAELFSALLTMGAGYVAIQAGTAGLVLVVLVLLLLVVARILVNRTQRYAESRR